MKKLIDPIQKAKAVRLREILAMRKRGRPVQEIAERLGLTRARIYQIIKGTR